MLYKRMLIIKIDRLQREWIYKNDTNENDINENKRLFIVLLLLQLYTFKKKFWNVPSLNVWNRL